MKRIAFLLLLCFPGAGIHAQRIIDKAQEQAESDPLQFLYSCFFPDFKYPLKKLVVMNEVKDTTEIYRFDKQGNRETLDRYSKNKPAARVSYTYAGGLLTQEVEIRKDGEDTTRYRYNSAKQLVESATTRWLYDKKVHHTEDYRSSGLAYEYKGGQLSRLYRVDWKKEKALLREYFYDQSSRLTGTTIGMSRTNFEYADKLLVKQSAFYISSTDTAVTAYKYNKQGQLIQKLGKSDTLTYLYDGALLKKCIYKSAIQRGDGQETVEFFYDKNTLAKIELKRNTPYSFSSFFRFRDDILYYSSKNGIKLRIEFVYDDHGNIRELKYYGNDQYAYSLTFVYEYYTKAF